MLPKVFSSTIFMAVLLLVPVYWEWLLPAISPPDGIFNCNAPVTYPVVPGFCLNGVRCIAGLLPRLSEARLYRYLTG